MSDGTVDDYAQRTSAELAEQCSRYGVVDTAVEAHVNQFMSHDVAPFETLGWLTSTIMRLAADHKPAHRPGTLCRTCIDIRSALVAIAAYRRTMEASS